MKIEANRPIRPGAGRRDGKVGGESFADALGGGAGAAPAAGSGPVGRLATLFALQEVPDATTERRKAVARASRLLDRLGAIQLGLIDGTIDGSALASLAATAREARARADDPALQGVLDEIELRAAVELAKLAS